jgi:hypothetical protein
MVSTACGAECVDVMTSAAHCGDCGMACMATELCEQGMCVPDPTPPADAGTDGGTDGG